MIDDESTGNGSSPVKGTIEAPPDTILAPPSPAAHAASHNAATAIEFEPPLACVRRLLKVALPASTNVGKDASAAFSRACGIFILYLTTCANDFARENRRQTITAADVLAAVKELDFDDFTPHLAAFLEKHRAEEKSKKREKERLKLSYVAPTPLFARTDRADGDEEGEAATDGADGDDENPTPTKKRKLSEEGNDDNDVAAGGESTAVGGDKKGGDEAEESDAGDEKGEEEDLQADAGD